MKFRPSNDKCITNCYSVFGVIVFSFMFFSKPMRFIGMIVWILFVYSESGFCSAHFIWRYPSSMYNIEYKIFKQFANFAFLFINLVTKILRNTAFNFTWLKDSALTAVK